MCCKECRHIIEKLLQYVITGDMEDLQLDEMMDHVQQCPSCKKEFKDFGRFEDIIKNAFSSTTTNEQAINSILSKLRKT